MSELDGGHYDLGDAVVLLQVWAARREMLDAPDGFSRAALATLMAHMLRDPAVRRRRLTPPSG